MNHLIERAFNCEQLPIEEWVDDHELGLLLELVKRVAREHTGSGIFAADTAAGIRGSQISVQAIIIIIESLPREVARFSNSVVDTPTPASVYHQSSGNIAIH